ncbi:hypothetical protein QJS04_geneDACA006378 [Acorus gramineus]|uniref:Uncharacterized protein n=1 Tax=Acorus gramineus TaxID=55184 RepID=A0AAV9AZX2_ACOGR|nr:hypothetical protein QJS04_geneDACA006378 [Acorus gramineus]
MTHKSKPNNTFPKQTHPNVGPYSHPPSHRYRQQHLQAIRLQIRLRPVNPLANARSPPRLPPTIADGNHFLEQHAQGPLPPIGPRRAPPRWAVVVGRGDAAEAEGEEGEGGGDDVGDTWELSGEREPEVEGPEEGGEFEGVEDRHLPPHH